VKIKLDWQKRAIILFAFIVLIVSIVLTVFAIREAERDKLLRQNEIESEQERMTASIDGQVRAKIRKAEELVLSLFGPNHDDFDEKRLAESASRIEKSESLIDEIFYIDGNGQINFPLFRPLYRLDGETTSIGKSPDEIQSHDLFSAAETAEFKTRDFALAIDLYRQLLASTSDRSSRALLLNRIARCYKSSRRPTRAIQTYRRIVNDYPTESSADGIPFALIALHQLGDLHSGSGNHQESLRTYLELYEALLEPRWELSQAQYKTYLRETKNKLDSLKLKMNAADIEGDSATRWAKLEQSEKEKSERMETIEWIVQKMSSVHSIGKTESSQGSGTFARFADRAGDELLLLSYTFLDMNSLFGFSMDVGYFQKDVLPSVLVDMPQKDGFVVQVSDEKENVLAGEETTEELGLEARLSVSKKFSDNFPPWTIHIYQTSPDEAERQFSLRRNIYVFSVVVVIVALLFGGILAIRSTAKELRLAKLKSDFVSTVSHEFRTPLTSIRYLAELLQRGRVQEESKKQQYYESITNESERLSRLIENILDFSKIEAGMKEYEFEETDPAELFRDVVTRFQEQVAPQGFTIENEIEEGLSKIQADKEALGRAQFNLLDNAAKYSGESRKIRFRAYSDKNHVYMKVEDQGIGIQKEDLDRVFGKFFRSSDAQSSDVKGSGIGLTLVSHIVKAHGGKVVLESEPGRGTRVTLQLPLNRQATGE
jgi:signal transduction histidine kinase